MQVKLNYNQLYKNYRVFQVKVTSTDANSNWELLAIRFTAQSLGQNSLPATTRV